MNHDSTGKSNRAPVRKTPVNWTVAGGRNAQVKGRTRSTGQSIVEFALIAPLLLLLIFGIIDMARLIQAQVTVSNAARTGLRFAITGQREQNADGTYKTREESIKAKAKAALTGLPLSNSIYTDDFGFHSVNLNDKDGNNTAGGPNELIEIRVYYNVEMFTPLVNAILPRVLVMGYERGLNEEWGAVQTFNHANLPPAPPAPPTWTQAPTRTPTPMPATKTYVAQLTAVVQTNTAAAGMTQTSAASTSTAVAGLTQTAAVVQTNTAVAGQTQTSVVKTATVAAGQTSTAIVNQTNTAVAGLTQTSIAAVTNTAVAAQSQTAAVIQSSTARANQTNTAAAAMTQTAIAKQLRLQNVRFVKPDGNGQRIDIVVDLVDGYGAAVGGATVNVSGAYSNSLLQYGAGTYYRCSVGSFNGINGGDVTITITASKAGYTSTSVTVTNTEGDIC